MNTTEKRLAIKWWGGMDDTNKRKCVATFLPDIDYWDINEKQIHRLWKKHIIADWWNVQDNDRKKVLVFVHLQESYPIALDEDSMLKMYMLQEHPSTKNEFKSVEDEMKHDHKTIADALDFVVNYKVRIGDNHGDQLALDCCVSNARVALEKVSQRWWGSLTTDERRDFVKSSYPENWYGLQKHEHDAIISKIYISTLK